MKHIMELSARWSVQLVCHFSYLLSDLEWTIEAWSKLVVTLDVERCNWTIDEAKPYPLSNRVGHLLVLLVIKRVEILLGLFQSVPDFLLKFISLSQRLMHCRYVSCTRLIGWNDWGSQP
jgi:hypothetical protein